MVQIEISAQESESQLFMVELQGSIEMTGVVGEGLGVHIGELVFRKDRPYLHIGNHVLEGKKVPLPLPLAYLTKYTTMSRHYRTASVFLEKYLFKTRPEHLVTSIK